MSKQPLLARKKYGQHFLTDSLVLNRILVSINPAAAEHFIEIGPGNGVLSFPLAAACRELNAVEIDERLYKEVQARRTANMRIIHSDAQHYDFGRILQNESRLVGNLPYNIAVLLIERLLNFPNIKDMHFLVQKEIAQRLFALPGHKHYGRLSLLCAAAAAGESLFDVPARCFHPQPQVRSAFIRLIPKSHRELADMNMGLFKRLTCTAFNRKNRKLRNTLAVYECDPLLRRLNLAEKRARDTSLGEFISLARALGG